MKLTSVDIWSLNIEDFRYHATPYGNIFGYQSEWSEWYDLRYEEYEEEQRLTDVDAAHKNVPTDLGAGFYLGNDIEEAHAWGARFDWAEPVLNVFDLSAIGNNGLVLDVFNNHDDLMYWIVSTARDREKGQGNFANSQRYYNALVERFGVSLEGYDWILAPRSDDSMWSFTEMYLNGDITTEALLHCTDNLSAGYQVVIKTQTAADRLVFCEYERYNVGKYPSLYQDGLINGYYDFLDIIGLGEYSAAVSPDKESIHDIIGVDKFVLNNS